MFWIRLKQWNARSLDFRSLLSLKNMLFDSPDLTRENKIPVSEFRRIRSEHDHAPIKNKLAETEDLIISEITDQQGMVDLNAFSDVVDLFIYLPNKDSGVENHQQRSPMIHQILSSNMRDKASAETKKEGEQEIYLKRMLDFVWIRI